MGNGLKILMLGNSLTYANDMPGMIAELAARAGEARPTVVVEALGGPELKNVREPVNQMRQALHTSPLPEKATGPS